MEMLMDSWRESAVLREQLKLIKQLQAKAEEEEEPWDSLNN